MNWKKIKVGFVLGVFVIGMVAVIAPVKQASAASFFSSDTSDLGDLFVLDKLFEDTNSSRIFDNSGTGLGDLFILDQLFSEEETTPVVQAPVSTAPSVSNKLSGRILIQVEENGEAWYVNKVTGERMFLGKPAESFTRMSDVSLGISNADFDDIKSAGVPERLVGRFLIKPQDDGKLYYVNPTDKAIISVTGPEAAMMLISDTGLGITNSDLAKIAITN